MAIASQIITNFELQVSDITELSGAEELLILNRIYQRVCSERPWEFLKTSATGTMAGSGMDGSYISIPSDFAFFSSNFQYTDNTISPQNNAAPKVIFVGANYSPTYLVNYSDRRQYRGSIGYAYLDLANDKIVFTGTPIQRTYDFDYLKVPPTLTASDTPLIPERFQDVLVYGMAAEDAVLQLSPKATSYAQENRALYAQYIIDMAYWNAQLQLN
jgi:hypothetical protein